MKLFYRNSINLIIAISCFARIVDSHGEFLQTEAGKARVIIVDPNAVRNTKNVISPSPSGLVTSERVKVIIVDPNAADLLERNTENVIDPSIDLVTEAGKARVIIVDPNSADPNARNTESIIIPSSTVNLENALIKRTTWKERRNRILERMRARLGMLEQTRKKDEIRRAQKLRDKKVKELKTAMNNVKNGATEIIRINEVLKDGTQMPAETPVKLDHGSQAKILNDKGKNAVSITNSLFNDFSKNADIGLITNDIAGQLKSGNQAAFDSVAAIKDNKKIVDFTTTRGDKNGQLLQKTISSHNMPLSGPVEPSFTTNGIQIIDPAGFSDPLIPLDNSGNLEGTPAIENNIPLRIVDGETGIPLVPAELGINVPFVPFTQIDSRVPGKSEFNVPAVNVIPEKETTLGIHNIPNVANNTQEIFPFESPQSHRTQSPLNPKAEGPEEKSGRGIISSSIENVSDPPVEPPTKEIARTSLNEFQINQTSDPTVLDTQNSDGEIGFNSSSGDWGQAVILQPVDLREFLSSGQINPLENHLPEEQPKTRQEPKSAMSGIRMLNGEIMPVAGRPRSTSTSGNPDVAASKSKIPASSLLGVLFDIQRSLRNWN